MKYLFSISKNSLCLLLMILFVLLFASEAFSAMLGDESMQKLYDSIRDRAFKEWMPRITKYTIGLLMVTTTIAFAIGCKDLALSGSGIQLEGIVALFVRYAFISGFMFWLLSLPGRLYLIPLSLEMLGGYIATGTAATVLSFSGMSFAFDNILGPIYAYYQTLGITELGLCITCCILVFIINCLFVMFLTTILLVKIECFFVFIGGLLTAAFFVFGYFRDIFMGYIKALAMVGLKLLLLSLCFGLMKGIIEDWGIKLFQATVSGMDSNILYNMAIPIVFGLMAFYIVIKSVPQYAVAILTGHATADGSQAKAAVMAAVGTVTTITSVYRGISQTAINSASSVHNAAQAYNNAVSPVRNAIDKELGGDYSKMTQNQKNRMYEANSAGKWAAVKTLLTSPIGGSNGRSSNGHGVNTKAQNEMKTGETALFEEQYKNKEGVQQ